MNYLLYLCSKLLNFGVLFFFSNTKLLIFGNFYFIIGKSLNSFNQKSDAIDDYTKAFYLVNKMTPEIAKHSTYPLIVQKLLDSTIRLDKLSDKEMDNVLSPILGEEWRSYVKEYRKN